LKTFVCLMACLHSVVQASAQSQEGADVAVEYRATGMGGTVRVAGQCGLPDGAFVQTSLQRVGLSAGLSSTRLGSTDLGEPESVTVEVKGGKFVAEFSIRICGEYRLKVSFKRLFQEHRRIFDLIGTRLEEFELARKCSFGATPQVIEGLRQGLIDMESLTRRLESILGDVGIKTARQVAESLTKLMAESREATHRSLLTGTLLAHVDACALYHKMIAIDGPQARPGATGTTVNPLQMNDAPKEAARSIAPAGGAKVQVDLAHLKRLAAREAAILFLARVRVLSGSAGRNEEAAALISFADAAEPLDTLLGEVKELLSEASSKGDSELWERVSSEAGLLSDRLASSVR
jgi:hypothetical protein